MDPVEAVIEKALADAKIRFERGRGQPVDAGLDFYLPDLGIYIECKQFHTERIAEQMSRAENVIAIQGMKAAIIFGKLINR